MPSPDDLLEDDRDGPGMELDVRETVNGTTFMGVYRVKDGAVLLINLDFGEASAALDGQAPAAVAARLLREVARAGMARSEEPVMRDGEAN